MRAKKVRARARSNKAARQSSDRGNDAGFSLHDINQLHADAAGLGLVRQRQRLIEADSVTRKMYPICTGLLDYFPDACAAVAEVSYRGNQKHNPGEPMHHARGKSMDHADCIARHLEERGGFDGDIRHTAALAWRAMALLQEELEAEYGLPLPRGAKL
jgi:hypothetical protein